MQTSSSPLAEKLSKISPQDLRNFELRLPTEDEEQISIELETSHLSSSKASIWLPTIQDGEWMELTIHSQGPGRSLLLPEGKVKINPGLKFIDIISRFKSGYLPQGEVHYLDSLCVYKAGYSNFIIANEYKSLNVLLMTDRSSNPDRLVDTILSNLISLMSDLFDNNVYIYPKIDDIHVGFDYENIVDSDNEDGAVASTILFNPTERNISYEQLSEDEYIKKNISLFTDIIRLTYDLDYRNSIDPARINDEFLNRVRDNNVKFNELPVTYDGNSIHLRDKVSYIHLVPSTSSNDLASIIYPFAVSHLPLSSLFMAIDLYYRAGRVNGIVEIVKWIYEKKEVYNYSLIKPILEVSVGKLYVNPIYNNLYDLTQLSTFYKWVIENNPNIYPQVDINKYISRLPKTGDSKFITCYDFFNPAEYYNPNDDPYSKKYI